MSERSPFQRFIYEIRRRHVPQTAAVYVVAAWAVIQFADVVTPNLGWPQGVVTAVIIAAAVGFPVVLVLAWMFDLGPEGVHRTPDTEAASFEDAREIGSARLRAGRGWAGGAPWVAALSVLGVGIGSAVAVTLLLGGGREERGGESAVPEGSTATAPAWRGAWRTREADAPSAASGVPKGVEGLGKEWQAAMERARSRLSALDSAGGLTRLLEFADQLDPGGPLLMAAPAGWGKPGRVAEVHPGDTVLVAGEARDSVGVASVQVDGRMVAQAKSPTPVLPFETKLVAAPQQRPRTVVVVVRTVDGRAIHREYLLVAGP